VAAFEEFDLLTNLGTSAFALEDASVANCEVKFSWEGKHNGVFISVRTEKRAMEMQPPWDFRSHLDVKSLKFSVLYVDVDYYTTTPLRRDQVDVAEWLGSSRRLVRRGLAKEIFA
jgi:hypothetical protein